MKIPKMTKNNQVLIILGLMIIIISSVFIYDYTQNNPRFCITCHLMNPAYETWDHSAMHDLNCHKCHETDIAESIGHVVEVVTINPKEVTKLVEIENEACENCHASEDPQWLQVANTAGHQVHFYGGINYADCIDCHGERLHVFEPPEETCLGCHGEERRHPEEIMITHCIDCHQFTAKERELIPKRYECIVCHEESASMGESFPLIAHTESACRNCHNPHEEIVTLDCSLCHESVKGIHEVTAHADCISCHIPHSIKELRENCLSCHNDKKDHYSNVNCATCHSAV